MVDERSARQETTEAEDPKEYAAYVGAPLDPDYLARLREQEAGK